VTTGRTTRVEGIPLVAAVEYRVADLADVNLADPRNFLLGVAGLVVRLPDRTWGRAPYCLPFVNAAARIGVPTRSEQAFATAVLAANARFYARVEADARCLARVRDLHPSVRRLLTTLHIAHDSTPVRGVLEVLTDRLDHFSQLIYRIG
jgi:hypothetical protein